jgi:MFS family permease
MTCPSTATRISILIPTSPENETVSFGFAPTQPEQVSPNPSPKHTKVVIRRSLRASTADGVFATLFTNITGGALLSSFLLDLGASSSEIGLLAAIPMLANLLQPLGAYFSELTDSRHVYCAWIYSIARSLWLFLAVGIGWVSWQADLQTYAHPLLVGALVITAASHFLGALGSAAWLSWMAALVPRRLRGRYFGLRNSAANLTSLISVPLLGLFVSRWWGGAIQGYGLILGLGIVAGLVSLTFQNFMVDVNPQVQHQLTDTEASQPKFDLISVLRTQPSLIAFLIYLALWTFSVNLSAPFFNLYLLDSLHLDISQVTLYNSLSAGANLSLLMFWGRLADRVGNRLLMLGVGGLVAITPWLWLGTSASFNSIWLWFPLLHLLSGATWAAIELCTHNLQLNIAPVATQTSFLGWAAAMAGISGALGTIAGGFLADIDLTGGLLGLFAISGVSRLLSLSPLIFVHEQHGQRFSQIMQTLFPQVESSS